MYVPLLLTSTLYFSRTFIRHLLPHTVNFFLICPPPLHHFFRVFELLFAFFLCHLLLCTPSTCRLFRSMFLTATFSSSLPASSHCQFISLSSYQSIPSPSPKPSSIESSHTSTSSSTRLHSTHPSAQLPDLLKGPKDPLQWWCFGLLVQNFE